MCWIGFRGTIEWSPRFPDLTLLDYFLWESLKDKVHQNRSDNTEDLINRIRMEFICTCFYGNLRNSFIFLTSKFYKFYNMTQSNSGRWIHYIDSRWKPLWSSHFIGWICLAWNKKKEIELKLVIDIQIKYLNKDNRKKD